MFYTHQALDRADRLRRDNAGIARLRSDPAACLVPIRQGAALIADDDDGALKLACLPSDAVLPAGCGEPIFLGLVQARPWFAIPASDVDEQDAQSLAEQAIDATADDVAARFEELRRCGPLLPADDGALLAFARGLSWWQETCRFCSRCGAPLRVSNGGHVLLCEAQGAAHSHFPRTDPAVIMLVTHRAQDDAVERCLLGRNAGWPDGVFSTLAGFVEPGESLEQAVSREVFEEASIRTTDVRYISSQPWPFPRSIMLGFQARALDTDVRCDPHELADARWFTREELLGFGAWGDAGTGLKLPRPDSIARFLIERWLKRR